MGVLISPIVFAADSGLAGLLGNPILPVLLIVPIFYFLVIRPQQQQRRKTKDMLGNLKTGDRVLTSGGIYGTIVGFRDGVVQLQVANQVRVDVARSAISGLAAEESEGKSDSSTERASGGREAARSQAAGKGKKP